jgi:hypothetical protein
MQALRQFGECDSERIQNRPGYLMGVLRRLSEVPSTAPGRRSPRSSGTGLSRQRSGNGSDFERGRVWDRDRERDRDRSRR